MRQAGIERTMIVPWLAAQDLVDEAVARGEDRDTATAHVIAEWRSLNAWAVDVSAAHPEQLSCVVGVDPLLMDEATVVAEVAQRLADGAIGIKVAPISCRARPDDAAMEVVWREARSHGVFVLSQCGAGPGGADAWGHPRHFSDVALSYPDVQVQLAHLGNRAEDDLVSLMRRHDSVWSDLAMRLDGPMEDGWTAQALADLVRRVGTDRVLFGTNFPIVDQVAAAESFRALPLTDAELVAIGHDNACRLHGVSG
jgi:predicted TIM-barrel fold metal-dependent hydrolase